MHARMNKRTHNHTRPPSLPSHSLRNPGSLFPPPRHPFPCLRLRHAAREAMARMPIPLNYKTGQRPASHRWLSWIAIGVREISMTMSLRQASCGPNVVAQGVYGSRRSYTHVVRTYWTCVHLRLHTHRLYTGHICVVHTCVYICARSHSQKNRIYTVTQKSAITYGHKRSTYPHTHRQTHTLRTQGMACDGVACLVSNGNTKRLYLLSIFRVCPHDKLHHSA